MPVYKIDRTKIKAERNKKKKFKDVLDIDTNGPLPGNTLKMIVEFLQEAYKK